MKAHRWTGPSQRGSTQAQGLEPPAERSAREQRDHPLPNNSGRGLAEGLVQLRRGKEARWVDPLAESARYEQLLTEGFTA